MTTTIPNVIPPFEDELLYSYILRLADANGFDDISLFLKFYINDQKGLKNPTIKYYSEEPLNGLVKYLHPVLNADGSETDFLSFFLDHSMTRFFHAYQIYFPEDRLIREQFYTGKYLSSSVRYEFRNRPLLYFCPECMEEDMKKHGQHYIHRIHQNPYAHICPLHFCALKYYSGIPGEELSDNVVLKENKLIRNEYSDPYTRMCRELFEYNENLTYTFAWYKHILGIDRWSQFQKFEKQIDKQWVKPLVKSIITTSKSPRTDREIVLLLFCYIKNDENLSKTLSPKISEVESISHLIHSAEKTI